MYTPTSSLVRFPPRDEVLSRLLDTTSGLSSTEVYRGPVGRVFDSVRSVLHSTKEETLGLSDDQMCCST